MILERKTVSNLIMFHPFDEDYEPTQSLANEIQR